MLSDVARVERIKVIEQVESQYTMFQSPKNTIHSSAVESENTYHCE